MQQSHGLFAIAKLLVIFWCRLLNARQILTYYVVTNASATKDNTGTYVRGLYAFTMSKCTVAAYCARYISCSGDVHHTQINSVQTFQLFRWLCTCIFLCLQPGANVMAGGQSTHVEEVSSAIYSLWAKTTGPFLNVHNSCMWWRRKNIISGVRLLFRILSELNVLCTSPMKR